MRRTIVAALAAALLLSAAGCSEDEPRPKFADPTNSTSAVPKPLASSAEDAVELWIRGWNDLSNTGDASTIRVASDDTCGACENFIGPVLDLYGDGGQIKTRGWTIESLDSSPSMDADPYVDVTVKKAGGSNRPNAEAAPSRFAASRERIRFLLTETDEVWTVSDILSLQ